MKFNLTYEGRLPASANSPKKEDVWRIRKALHPQLLDLWSSHPALKDIEANGRYFPKTGGATLTQNHHDFPGPVIPPAKDQLVGLPRPEILDLCAEINKHGKSFRPLVRNTFALHCGLKVLFLRKESPGKVFQGGDIDGRMKTLFDALSMPQHSEQVLNDNDAPEVIYCLLEDDSMISGLNVESERLLGAGDLQKDYAKLTIEVDVRIRRATIYNQSFLG